MTRGTGESAGHSGGVAELERALAEARAEATWHRDQYLRSRAEMDNYRKRLEQRLEGRFLTYKRDLLLRLLPVLDSLDRALTHSSTSSTPPESLLTGLRLTYWQFQQVLLAEEVKPMTTIGHQFDPHRHEAIATETGSTIPEGTIVAEAQQGYTLGDAVLRPARVIVAALPAASPSREARSEPSQDGEGGSP
ncbi:MAG: nucleotide exchange factor GrpE [Chloroflexi bacterium]|nr:nucleotide exchange factor GrpE [Chloroflexota bacterium]